MLLSQNEIKLFKLALKWYEMWNNCNPDVGMGPTKEMLLNYLINQIKIYPTNQEKQEILR